VDYLRASAAISLIEHCLVHNDGRLNVLGGLPDVPLVPTHPALQDLLDDARDSGGQVLCAPRQPPRVQVARVGASFVRLCTGLENHMGMFLFLPRKEKNNKYVKIENIYIF